MKLFRIIITCQWLKIADITLVLRYREKLLRWVAIALYVNVCTAILFYYFILFYLVISFVPFF